MIAMQTHLWGVLFLGGLFLVFVSCASSPRHVIPLFLLGTVWDTCVPYGLVWNGSKVLVICIVVLWVLRAESFPRLKESLDPTLLVLLCAYVIAITVFGALTMEKNPALNSFQPSAFQEAPLRGIMATGYWFFGPICFLIGCRYTTSFRVVDTCAKVLLVSSAVAAIVAIMQFASYYTFPPAERGLAFFSSGNAYERAVTEEIASGAWGWYRPAPFCSEPRHFGFAMALAAATVILSRWCHLKSVPAALTHPVWIAIYIGLAFAAASTSAIAGLLIALSGLLLWLHSPKGYGVFRKKPAFTVVATVALSLGAVYWVDARTQVLHRRFEHYLTSYGLTQPVDRWFRGNDNTTGGSAYMAWLLKSPSALAMGVGPGNAAFCAFDYCSLRRGGDAAKGVILSSRFPIVDSLGSIGLLGNLLLVSFWCYCWRTCRHRSRGIPEPEAARILFVQGVLVFLILYLLCYDSTLLVWLAFGMLVRLNGPACHAVELSVPSVNPWSGGGVRPSAVRGLAHVHPRRGYPSANDHGQVTR